MHTCKVEITLPQIPTLGNSQHIRFQSLEIRAAVFSNACPARGWKTAGVPEVAAALLFPGFLNEGLEFFE